MKAKELNLDHVGYIVQIDPCGGLDLWDRIKHWWKPVMEEGELDSVWRQGSKFFVTMNGNTWEVHPEDKVQIFEQKTDRHSHDL